MGVRKGRRGASRDARSPIATGASRRCRTVKRGSETERSDKEVSTTNSAQTEQADSRKAAEDISAHQSRIILEIEVGVMIVGGNDDGSGGSRTVGEGGAGGKAGGSE